MENKQEKNNFKRIIRAYRDLLGILASEAPVMVVSVFIVAFALGLMDFLSVVVNRHIFDDGIALAQGKITFEMYLTLCHYVHTIGNNSRAVVSCLYLWIC